MTLIPIDHLLHCVCWLAGCGRKGFTCSQANLLGFLRLHTAIGEGGEEEEEGGGNDDELDQQLGMGGGDGDVMVENAAAIPLAASASSAAPSQRQQQQPEGLMAQNSLLGSSWVEQLPMEITIIGKGFMRLELS